MTLTGPRNLLLTVVIATSGAMAAGREAAAQRIENQVAVFAALDKVTARISKLEATLGETIKFGSLKVTPRVCFSRPPTEQPKTTSFVEIDETLLSGSEKRLFTGWMFAESPGLHAVEHPVFDIWLTDCRQPVKPQVPVAAAKPGQQGPAGTAAGAAPSEPAELRRRPRR